MLKETIMLPVEGIKIEVDIYGIRKLTYAFAESRRIVVIVPGLTCKNWVNYAPVYSDLATGLNERGFLCVVFSSRGQRPSGGKWLHANAVKDLDAVLKFLFSHGAKASALGLLGRSIGTSVTLSYLCEKPSMAGAAALWGTPFRKLYSSFFANINAAKLLMEPRLTSIDESFVFTEEMLPENLLPRIQNPLLMGYGSQDIYSTLEEQVESFKLLSNKTSSFVVVKDAIHEMDGSHVAFPIYFGSFSNWFAMTLTV